VNNDKKIQFEEFIKLAKEIFGVVFIEGKSSRNLLEDPQVDEDDPKYKTAQDFM